MVKNLTSILLATNLKEYNKVAFDVAMSLAAHYNAKLVLLHVLEDLSEQAEKMVKWIIDAEQRKKLREAEAEEARRKLIGKNISSAIIKNSITEYCKTMGTNENICLNPIREVAICEGEVVEEILKAAQEHDVGMIVMAAHEGLFDKSSISRTIRSVLKKATVPVLTVPHVFDK